MIAHQELVDRVTAHGEVTDNGQARRAVETVVGVLSTQVGPDLRERLQRSLPPSLIPEQASAPQIEGTGGMAQEIGRELGCRPEQGLHLARVVLSSIAASAPELKDDLAGTLPEELAEWTADPTGAAARSDVGAGGAASRLGTAELNAALQRIPDWAGDTGGLSRTVRLPQDRIPPLTAGVDRIGREMGHPAHQETTGDGIAFTVRTASVGAVTTADIDLAERIDQAIAEVGSGG